MPVETGLARAKSRGEGEDRYERMGTDFHTRLRDGFLEIAKKDPHRCEVIDATGDVGAVAMAIHDAVATKLGVAF